jgi:hypothetical protein
VVFKYRKCGIAIPCGFYLLFYKGFIRAVQPKMLLTCVVDITKQPLLAAASRGGLSFFRTGAKRLQRDTAQ